MNPVETAKRVVLVMCDPATLSMGMVQDVVRRKARRIEVASVVSLDKDSR